MKSSLARVSVPSAKRLAGDNYADSKKTSSTRFFSSEGTRSNRENNAQSLLLSQLPNRYRHVVLAQGSYDDFQVIPHDTKFWETYGLSRTDYNTLVENFEHHLKEYRLCLKTAHDCLIAGVSLTLVFPISTALFLSSRYKFRQSVGRLATAVHNMRTIVGMITGLKNGAHILVGLEEARFRQSFLEPGFCQTNLYYQRISIVLEIPWEHQSLVNS